MIWGVNASVAVVAALAAVVPQSAAAEPDVLLSARAYPADAAAVVGFDSVTGAVDVLVGSVGSNPAVADKAASWAPDGARFVFVSNRDRTVVGPMTTVHAELYVADADGGDQRRLTFLARETEWASAPAWSPRGDRIAFLVSAWVNGRVQQTVRIVDADAGAPRTLVAPSEQQNRVPPRWAPDGRELLVGDADALLVVDADTGAARVVAGASALDAQWSPEGSEIVFAGSYRGIPGVFVVPRAGGLARVVSARAAAGEVAWSPDGTRIAFVVSRVFPTLQTRFGIPSMLEVWVASSAGGDERRLTGPLEPTYAPGRWSPRWWPDGTRLFVTGAARGSNDTTTWTVNADGTCERIFSTAFPRLVDPQWRPGARLTPPVRCVDLGVYADNDEYQPAALRKERRIGFRLENDGNERAEATLEVAATTGTLRLAFGDGVSCSGTAPLRCATVLAPGQSRYLTVGLTATRAGGVRVTAAATTSPSMTESDPSTNVASTNVTVLPCTIVGTWQADRLVGTRARDRICGLPGWDRIDAGAGADEIDAGSGNDTVIGGRGRDLIHGGGGHDVILVRDGERDRVNCGVQRDVVVADPIDIIARDCEAVRRS